MFFLKCPVFRILLCLCVFLCFSWHARAQISFGPKIGFQATSIGYSSLYDGEPQTGSPKLSLQAGGVYNYQVNSLLSFYTELYYTQKGKHYRNDLSSGIVQHRSLYHFMELPVMLRFSFPLKALHASWYANLGPHVAYWMAGKGSITARENFYSTEVYQMDYRIQFREHAPAPGYVYAEGANRFQFGLNFGAGFVLPVARHSKEKLMFDLRYTLGNTFMGSNTNLPVGDTEVVENLAFHNHALQASVAYLFSLDLRSLRKGKSTRRR